MAHFGPAVDSGITRHWLAARYTAIAVCTAHTEDSIIRRQKARSHALASAIHRALCARAANATSSLNQNGQDESVWRKGGTMQRSMSQVAVAGLCALLLMTGVGCGASEHALADSGTAPSDAGQDATDATDATGVPIPVLDAAPATPIDASVDLPFLLIAVLLEMERSLIARCPCLTAAGEYDSASECLSRTSLGRNWIDCANRVDLSGYDSDETREALRCNVEQLSLRSDCLMGSSCASDAIAACMTQTLNCADLPYELISKVVTECMITLSR